MGEKLEQIGDKIKISVNVKKCSKSLVNNEIDI